MINQQESDLAAVTGAIRDALNQAGVDIPPSVVDQAAVAAVGAIRANSPVGAGGRSEAAKRFGTGK